MANPDGSMDGWVAEQQEEGRASYHCRQDEGLLTTGLAACPKTRNNLMESRPCFSMSPIGGAGGAYDRIKPTLDLQKGFGRLA